VSKFINYSTVFGIYARTVFGIYRYALTVFGIYARTVFGTYMYSKTVRAYIYSFWYIYVQFLVHICIHVPKTVRAYIPKTVCFLSRLILHVGRSRKSVFRADLHLGRVRLRVE